MREDERLFLKHALTTVNQMAHEFFHHRQETKVQLLSNQFQYFQSVAGISLAVVTILLTTKTVSISTWWMLMLVTGLMLITYISTYIRELNDGWDKGLAKEEESLELMRTNIENVVAEAIKKDDFSIYENATKTAPKHEDPQLSYAGELVVFLFFLTILFGAVATLNERSIFSQCILWTITVGGIILCFFLSFKDWNLKLTERISAALHLILKK